MTVPSPEAVAQVKAVLNQALLQELAGVEETDDEGKPLDAVTVALMVAYRIDFGS